MTVHAIGALLAFNLFVLAVGAGALWGIRGWEWWTELVRLAGVAYLLGLSALMLVMTLEIVLGIPIRAATVVLSGLAIVALGIAEGARRGRRLPSLRPPGWRFPTLSVFAAAFVAGIVVYLEGLVRADRLSGIAREWDSWAFWMPKATGLFYSGRLDTEFLLQLPQRPSYPPGLTTIQAGAFHAMGSPDTTSLHVQYWFFAVAFLAAVAGLLAPRVHQAILFPVLLAFLVAPNLLERITTVYADIPMGYLVAVAALLVVLWIDERKSWHLVAAAVLLAGAMSTKREGLLFVACVLLAGLAASARDWRRAWPRLGAAVLVAFVLTLPWRVWFTAQGLQGDGPDAGYLGAFSYLERVWPSLKLVVRTLYDQDLWRVAPFLAVAAILLAALARAWTISVYATVFLASAILASTWAIWSNVTLRIIQDDSGNPVIRLAGTVFLVLAALTPLLLERAWSAWGADAGARSRAARLGPDALVWRSRAAWGIVALGLLSHPGSMLVGYSGSGLPGGAPRFPSASDCVLEPVSGKDVQVVVGRADSYDEADAIRERAREAGLPKVDVANDGCGALRVAVADLPIESAQSVLADAEAAGLEPSLEPDPSS